MKNVPRRSPKFNFNYYCQCERCGEILDGNRVVWLELSNTDGKYYKINELTKRSIPDGHISQGAFPFGSTCAKEQLKETENEKRTS